MASPVSVCAAQTRSPCTGREPEWPDGAAQCKPGGKFTSQSSGWEIGMVFSAIFQKLCVRFLFLLSVSLSLSRYSCLVRKCCGVELFAWFVRFSIFPHSRVTFFSSIQNSPVNCNGRSRGAHNAAVIIRPCFHYNRLASISCRSIVCRSDFHLIVLRDMLPSRSCRAGQV